MRETLTLEGKHKEMGRDQLASYSTVVTRVHMELTSMQCLSHIQDQSVDG